MRALWLEDGQARMRDVPDPSPGPGEALVRPLVVGVCNTDLELLRGYYGFTGIPGHELVGVVESAPERPRLEGRLVCADINFGCGHCPRCRAGDARHCPDRRALGIKGAPGALAQRVVIPTHCLIPLPAGLDPRAAVFAEPLAAALEPGQQMHLTASTRLLVLGDGKLGLLCALGLRLQAPGLVLAGRHTGKLAIATAQGVATALVSPQEDGPALARRLGRYDVVIEATGSASGLAHALDLVEPEGVIVAKTTTHRPASLDLARLVVNEVTLMGSRCGDLRLALTYLANRWLAVEELIEAVYPLEEAPQALEHAARRGAKKVLVEVAAG